MSTFFGVPPEKAPAPQARSVFAARIGIPVEAGAEILRQRRAALQEKAASLPATSPQRSQLESEAAALTARVARPAWHNSNEGQSLRRRLKE